MDGLPFDFAWPLALYALVLVPLIGAAAWRGERRRAAADAAYGGGEGLRVGRSMLLRGVRTTLFLLALTVLIIGVARPRWGTEPAALEQRGIDVVIAVDVSRSMEAADVSPSRAEAAARGVQQMLTHLHGNRVGLVIFGGSALERAPLTLDIDAISTLVARAQREAALVEPGTSLAVAIDAALATLDVPDPAHAQAILLVSDGEDLSDRPLEPAIERARDRGVPVFALFSGTDIPTPIDVGRGGEQVTTADRTTMDQIAAATGGQVREPANVAGLAVEFRRMRQTEFAAEAEPVRTERFAWFLGGALALLVAQGLVPQATDARRARPRRGPVAAGGIAALLLLGACGGTAVWQHVDAGNRAHDAARYEEALEWYRTALELEQVAEDEELAAALHYNAGNTLHELGEYEAAVSASETARELTEEDPELAASARYALGNHFYRLDDLEAARDAYVAVLRFDPDDRRAKENLELVLRQMPPPEEDDETLPGDEDNGEPGNGDDDGPPGENDEPAPSEDDAEPNGDEFNGDPMPGDPGDELPDTVDQARQQLLDALGELGDEITVEEALRLLELHRRVNELDSLPARPDEGAPTR